ncbi:hypothetical protein MTO96_016354 [Rhipicephalus appendiculatus]
MARCRGRPDGFAAATTDPSTRVDSTLSQPDGGARISTPLARRRCTVTGCASTSAAIDVTVGRLTRHSCRLPSRPARVAWRRSAGSVASLPPSVVVEGRRTPLETSLTEGAPFASALENSVQEEGRAREA